MTPPPKVASSEAIRHHYDQSNEFFALWLDPTMCYSCAMWEEGVADLETAQTRKLDYHLEQAGLNAGGTVLDVGCGWGGIIGRAVERFGASQAVGLTLSLAQHDWITAHPHPAVEVRLENWTDHRPTQRYDAITSVGAFEHFAQVDSTAEDRLRTYAAFFRRCREWLIPGGRLSLQTFAYASAKTRERNRQSAGTQFLASNIFPETDPPLLTEILTAAEDSFEVIRLRNDRLDYARTCEVWLERLSRRRAEAVELVGEKLVDRFATYLKLSHLGFAVGELHLYRVTLQATTGRKARAGF
jgi:cyclopropane-fatty-acyl-phospholipid synthase